MSPDANFYFFKDRTKHGGAERDRTADLRSAIAALSQLSYGPLTDSQYSNRRHQINHPSTRHGGAERDRTADPLLAKQVLSQLSYSPNLSVPTRSSRSGRPIGSTENVRLPCPNQKWWARADSNCRPHAYQACALTT